MRELADTVARLDAALEPIAKRPVDPSEPDWAEKMRAAEPLDEAGVRAEAEEALRALLHRYEHGDDRTRSAVRALFERHSSFRWAAHLPGADFRTRLLHLSARDQASDTRDELLELTDLCARARAEGVDIRPLLREVAALSGTTDKYGMGSIRDILLRCAE
jgi:hypothetical protein